MLGQDFREAPDFVEGVLVIRAARARASYPSFTAPLAPAYWRGADCARLTEIASHAGGFGFFELFGCSWLSSTNASSHTSLFQCDFAHGFGPEDFADVKTFHGGGAAFVFIDHG